MNITGCLDDLIGISFSESVALYMQIQTVIGFSLTSFSHGKAFSI
jgi:hypothetical protein